MRWKPNVTVAAVVERDERFLMVEEESGGRIVYNQPAGHLEKGESLTAAVVRETLEETAWRIRPTALVGLHQWTSPRNDRSFLRVCFAGEPVEQEHGRALDSGIRRACWFTREELAARCDSLRSPMVLRSVDDYLAGKRFDLDMLAYLGGPGGAD